MTSITRTECKVETPEEPASAGVAPSTDETARNKGGKKKMLAKKIIKNLETGNYRVEYREHCDCRFDWRLEKDELVCDIASTDGDCWFDNVLIMDDLAGQSLVHTDGVLATYNALGGLNVRLRGQTTLAAFETAEQEIVNAIKDSDAYTQLIADIDSPDANNDLHDRRKREALIDWLCPAMTRQP